MNRHRNFIGEKRRELKLAPGMSPALTAAMARINYRRLVRM